MLKLFSSTPGEWEAAKRPNYKINVDLDYPYSECPHLGKYYLLKIPKTGLVEHVDYWGEGRIEIDAGISGFTDCYNVNHTFQLVSNGDANTINRKIANRIPVFSYTDCRTDSYIKNDSVKIVTLMGAPINKSCASDIARMVKNDEGMVVLYGYDRDTAGVNNLDEQLNPKGLVCCPGFELPDRLQGLTLFDRHLAFINLNDYNDILYNAVTSAEYDKAIRMCLELDKAHHYQVISDVVERLLKGDNSKTMTFAYKLWIGGGQIIVNDRFPSEFQNILRSDNVQIMNLNYEQSIKLDANVDQDKDRLAWGDKNDKTTTRIIWKCIPQILDEHVVFKLRNNEHTMFLKLEVNVDGDGDRRCYGSTASGEKRHNWSLEPVRHNGKLLFFIVNFEYKQGLKLAANPDVYGDRAVWGHNGNIINNPQYFGWVISSI